MFFGKNYISLFFECDDFHFYFVSDMIPKIDVILRVIENMNKNFRKLSSNVETLEIKAKHLEWAVEILNDDQIEWPKQLNRKRSSICV